jgi:hypothetical protein
MALSEPARRLTAAQIILMAGEELTNNGLDEFSEWELTVAAWKQDRDRFGLRGFKDEYPDHKRVMMEIMGQKPHNPLQLKLMEKILPNYYKLTSLGRNEATRLRTAAPGDLRPVATRAPRSTAVKVKATATAATAAAPVYTPLPVERPASGRRTASGDQLYDLVYDHVFHATFAAWKDDPEEPRNWSQAVGFFTRNARSEHVGDAANDIERAVRAALDYCTLNDLHFLAPGSKGTRRIPVNDLIRLNDFLTAMRGRFEAYLGNGRKEAVKG